MKPRALVITGNGINCERESAHACRLAGMEADIAHMSAIFAGEVRLRDYNFIHLPGGFLDGDDLGSAKAGAVRFKYGTVKENSGTARFEDELLEFVGRGGLVLGVCNGFQLMVKLGLLPFTGGRLVQEVSLMHNDSGRFEDRWVSLKADPRSPCVFTKGIDTLYFPVRHGEGKFVPGGEEAQKKIIDNSLAVLRYIDSEGNATGEYPFNPNGSFDAIAGICDPTGRLFGLMPHPEAFVHRTQHPRWTREELPEEGQGLKLYQNAAEYIRNS
jgi:phosphoribosylformylglycinamidine synthase